jgi:hypothetical protein
LAFSPPLRIVALLATALVSIGAKHPRPPITLGLPLQCHFGQDCMIQNYLDDDPSANAHDFLCRGRTYDGHNGTDFRIESMDRQRAGVNVIASAPGRVLRVRDGVADISVKVGGKAAIANEECGNGMVIDDGHGWETQYCHLAKGSLRVRRGQHVRAGQVLGRVGLSGNTEFPHVHLTVRQDGKLIDPFAYGAAPGSCGGGQALWKERLSYQSGEVLSAGFSSGPVTEDAAFEHGARQPRPTATSPYLVAFVEAIGLEKGDIQKLSLTAPDGQVLVNQTDAPLDHDKAVYLFYIGKRLKAAGWAPGIYQADYSLRRGGVEVLARSFRTSIDEQTKNSFRP